jgi:hypothetical protein
MHYPETLPDLIRQSFFLTESPPLSEQEARKIFRAISLQEQNPDMQHAGISELLSSGIIRPQPRVILTHDIDWLYGMHPAGLIKWLRYKAGGSPWLSLQELYNSNTFMKAIEDMMIFEKENDVASVFLIGIESRLSSLRRYGIRYIPDHPRFRQLTGLLSKKNTGYHSSTLNRKEFVSHKTQLDAILHRENTYHRSHYLRLKGTGYLEWAEASALKYELGNGRIRKPGFACGTANTFRIFDVERNKLSDICCIPMILSDNAFFISPYRKILDEFEACLEQVIRYSGCVNILFHPENMLLKPVLWKAYEEIIHICKKSGVDLTPLT